MVVMFIPILAGFLIFAQSDTRAPEGQRAVLTATGKGVQIYVCQNAQWVFPSEPPEFRDAAKSVTTQAFEIVTFLQLVSEQGCVPPEKDGQKLGMKKHIREMIDDLKNSKTKDFIPSVPKGAKENPMVSLTPPAEAPVPDDLSNQVLSENAEKKVKQLDYQAFESERIQTNS